jgi:integrase
VRIYKDAKSKNWYLDARDEGSGRYSLKTKDKKIAEKILAQKQIETLEGIHEVKLHREEKRVIRLEDAIDQYIESAEGRIKPKTLKDYKQSKTNLMKYFDSGKDVLDVNLKTVEKFISDRLKTVKPATVNKDLQLLKATLGKLKKWGDIKENPIDSLKKLNENNIRTRILTDKEEIILSQALPAVSDYMRLAIVMSLNTGMRKGEILSLYLPNGKNWVDKAVKEKINWVDLPNRIIYLNETKHGFRQVPINDILYNELDQYIKTNEVTDKLFWMKDFKKSFNHIMEKLEIYDFTFHDLRRTFISRCAMQGYSREIIQSIVGQVSESVYKRYAHFSQDSKMKLLQEYGRIMAERCQGSLMYQ